MTYPRQWPRYRREWSPLRVLLEQRGHSLPEFIDQLDGPLMAAYSAKRGEVLPLVLAKIGGLVDSMIVVNN